MGQEVREDFQLAKHGGHPNSHDAHSLTDSNAVKSGLTIPVLLNEAQKSSVGPGQVRYASVLWSRLDMGADEADACSGELDSSSVSVAEHELHHLIVCLKWMVSLSARNLYHDRLVKFFGILASMASTRARVACVEVLLGFLVEWSKAEGHLVRWRVCQLVGNLVNNMPEGADVDGGVLDGVEGAMRRLLLQDGKPHVRAAAARYVDVVHGIWYAVCSSRSPTYAHKRVNCFNCLLLQLRTGLC